MFNCSKIEDELAEKQIVIFHKSVEYWPKMLRSVELTQAVGIHIDYEERNYGQKGSSIPSALNWSQISGKVQRAQTSDNGRYHSNSLIPYLPLSSSWSPELSSVWGGGRSSTRSPHNSTRRTNTGGREMSLCSISSSGKPLLKRFLKRHIITSQLWSHCWTTGTILMPPVLREGSLRATELGDLRTSAWEDRRGDDCCGNDSSDWNLIFCHQEMRQIWWMVKV